MKVTIKIQVKSQEANPGPPVGPALGSKGVNIINFCNRFNETTKNMLDIKKGTLVSVVISVYKDKSFDFFIKYPPASVLIKNIMNIPKGSNFPNKLKVGKISIEQLISVFKQKEKDFIVNSQEAAIKTLMGTAKSMGVDVE